MVEEQIIQSQSGYKFGFQIHKIRIQFWISNPRNWVQIHGTTINRSSSRQKNLCILPTETRYAARRIPRGQEHQCIKDIFLNQPNLLELEAPIKICGKIIFFFSLQSCFMIWIFIGCIVCKYFSTLTFS